MNNTNTNSDISKDRTGYNRFLPIVAGLGGLLYGVDIGIIAGALPYLVAASGLNSGQLSIVVAAVLHREFQCSSSRLPKFPTSTFAWHQADGFFRTNAMRLLLQDNRGPEPAVETGIPCILAAPQIGPLFVTKPGSQVTITWMGSGTLQFSSSRAPGSWTNLPNATSPYTIQAGVAQQFFRLAE